MAHVYTLGVNPVGERARIPSEMLTTSVPGKLYEVRVRTDSIPDEDKPDVAAALVNEIPGRVEGAEVKHVAVGDESVVFTVEGSPFTWSLMMGAIPAILQLFGISVILIGIYLVWSEIPSWQIGLIILGIALIYTGPVIGGLMSESLDYIMGARET